MSLPFSEPIGKILPAPTRHRGSHNYDPMSRPPRPAGFVGQDIWGMYAPGPPTDADVALFRQQVTSSVLAEGGGERSAFWKPAYEKAISLDPSPAPAAVTTATVDAASRSTSSYDVGALDIDMEAGGGDALTVNDLARGDVICFAPRQREAIGGALAGDQKLVELETTLAVFNPRDPIQIEAQKKFTCCALPHLYGEAYASQRERLSKQFGVEVLRHLTAMVVPRRHGKTEGTSMFVAAYTYVECKYSSFVIELIGKGIQGCDALMNAVKKQLARLKDAFGDFTYELNSARRIKITRGNHSVLIRCWTDSLKYTRGFGDNGMVIVDEAVQMSKQFFEENLAPVMTMRNTSFAIISSPGPEDCWLTRLMTVKDENGRLAFDVLNQVFICDDCMKLPYAKRVDCTHVRQPPFWLSAEKQNLNRLAAKAMGGERALLVEQKGMTNTLCSMPAFEATLLDKVFAIPYTPYARAARPRNLFIAIDPSGEGPSRTGVVTGYVDQGNLVVCSSRPCPCPCSCCCCCCCWCCYCREGRRCTCPHRRCRRLQQLPLVSLSVGTRRR